jgi:putative nucleotidyltransferase-like protein
MSGGSSPPETRLLLLLAHGSMSADARDEARIILGREIGWSRILRQATANGLLPLVTRNLRQLGFPGVPTPVRAELETSYRRNAIRNVLMRGELIRVLKALGQVGVRAVPLKGLALAESLYGDMSLRTCSDLDVLVPRRAVGQVFEVLRAEGYDQADRCRVEQSDVEFLVRSSMEYGFVPRPPAFQSLLEIHWDIAWRWRNDTAMLDNLWAEARRQVFWGVEAWALSSEWELLYLAVHAARHRWQGLKWLVDIHEVCVRAKFDWDTVTDKAHRFGLDRALELSLSACQALFGTPLPAGYSGHPVPSWLPLFPASAPQMGEWRESLLVRHLFRRPLDRLRYLARIVLRPTLGELKFVRLPLGLRMLYYPLRLVRLAIATTCAVSKLAAVRNSLGF